MSVHGGPADWWTQGTDAGRKHVANKGIVQNGLILNLDAGVSDSYPGTGSTWYDLSGNGYHSTMFNSPGYSDLYGGTIHFDGINDYAKTPQIANLRSIIMWCNIDNPGSTWNYVFDARPGNTNGYFAITSSWAIGSWSNFYVNAIKQSSANGITLSTQIMLYTETDAQYTSTINIFSRFSDNEYMRGSISVFQVYNRVLTTQEIRQNFNATRGRYGI